jgi:hypothetical protein
MIFLPGLIDVESLINNTDRFTVVPLIIPTEYYEPVQSIS